MESVLLSIQAQLDRIEHHLEIIQSVLKDKEKRIKDTMPEHSL